METAIKRLRGNSELYKKLLYEFNDDYHDTIKDIQEALENNDTEKAINIAHNIKGVASNM